MKPAAPRSTTAQSHRTPSKLKSASARAGQHSLHSISRPQQQRKQSKDSPQPLSTWKQHSTAIAKAAAQASEWLATTLQPMQHVPTEGRASSTSDSPPSPHPRSGKPPRRNSPDRRQPNKQDYSSRSPFS